MIESLLHKWDYAYKGVSKNTIWSYGCDTTYKLAYNWLQDCELIEDWGAGMGFFKTLCKAGQYRGLDCSCTPHADEYVDFTAYRSQVPGIMMRHCLEHNHLWEDVLRNALASFTKRMALIIFTPWADKQTQICTDPKNGQPTFSFEPTQITNILKECDVKWSMEMNIPTRTMHKLEHVFYIWR